jgi:hypothetical protein
MAKMLILLDNARKPALKVSVALECPITNY